MRNDAKPDNSRSVSEIKDIVIRQVELWIGKGLCTNCAFLTTAAIFEVEHDKVEALWIDEQIRRLDAETALD